MVFFTPCVFANPVFRETERKSYQLWLAKTQEQVREGIDSLDQGEGINGETVVKELLMKLRQAKLFLPKLV